jgi:hypothetical protein
LSISGKAPGYSFASGFRSAKVKYPVSFTNLRNCLLVTGVRSIQKASTLTS